MDSDIALRKKVVPSCRNILGCPSETPLHVYAAPAAGHLDRETCGEHGFAVSAAIEMRPGRTCVGCGRRLLFQNSERIPVRSIRRRTEQVCELGVVIEEEHVI